MGEGFMAKLKALLMGSGGPTAPAEAPMEGKPWEDPSLAPPMSQVAPAMPQPSPTPMPQDDIGMQVQQLMKQREMMKRISPESAWNR